MLFRQECGIGHIAHDHAFVEHLVGEYPVFFEYGAVVTQCPPLYAFRELFIQFFDLSFIILPDYIIRPIFSVRSVVEFHLIPPPLL